MVGVICGAEIVTYILFWQGQFLPSIPSPVGQSRWMKSQSFPGRWVEMVWQKKKESESKVSETFESGENYCGQLRNDLSYHFLQARPTQTQKRQWPRP